MASWQRRKNDEETFVAPRKQVQFALDNLHCIVEEEGEEALTILWICLGKLHLQHHTDGCTISM